MPSVSKDERLRNRVQLTKQLALSFMVDSALLLAHNASNVE